MAASGPNYPGTIQESADTGGTRAWSSYASLTNALTSDNVRASCAIISPAAPTSYALCLTNFGFNIPSTATINSIQLEIEGYRNSATNTTFHVAVYTDVNRWTGGTIKTFTPSTTASGETFVTVGTPDMWGLSLSPANINNPNFGFGIWFTTTSGTSKTLNIDTVRVTVDYTPAAVTIPGTVGDAVAAGATAAVNLPTEVAGIIGNAIADGATATFTTTFTALCTPGDVIANGSTAAVTYTLPTYSSFVLGGMGPAGTISSFLLSGFDPSNALSVTTTVGDATAAGVTAAISANTYVSTAVGDAVAAGATFALNRTYNGLVGDAVAAGPLATISAIAATGPGPFILLGMGPDASISDFLLAGMGSSSNLSFTATVGDAVAAGAEASIQRAGVIETFIGNAVANGVQAAIARTIIAGVGNVVADGATFALAPTVTGVSPSSGVDSGGLSVTITGTNFKPTSIAYFGGAPATTAYVSPTQLTATTPAHTMGAVPIRVENDSGAVVGDEYYGLFEYTGQDLPVIDSISPTSGVPGGGTTVTINGYNFASNATVTFGGATSPTVTWNSSQEVLADTPEGAGSVDVTLTNPTTGWSATLLQGFTYFLVVQGTIGAAVATGADASINRELAASGQVGDAVADGPTARVDLGAAIAGIVGDAVAAGSTAAIAANLTIVAGVGNAVADGPSASIANEGVATIIAASVGNAVAAGGDATLIQGIDFGVGNAAADGALASISANLTVDAQIGVAVALGLPAAIGGNRQVDATIGGAVAVGLPAAINTRYEFQASVGDAVATGVLATISNSPVIGTTVGDAVADGRNAVISGQFVVPAAVGLAVAQGALARVDQARRIDCTIGAVVADGRTALYATGVLVGATAGNAVAAGRTATVNRALVVSTGVGNATAAGVLARAANPRGLPSKALRRFLYIARMKWF